jgi:ABC-2 type transport system permease protein
LRLELADVVRSRWLAFVLLTYALVFGVFGWLGLRESSVLGFTGLSRVVLNSANAIVVVLPLVTLVATSQAVVRARTTGLFELLLSQPCRASEWFAAATVARVIVLAGPLIAALLLILGMGMLTGEVEATSVALRAGATSFALIVGFAGVGMWLSAYSRTAERAVVLSLLVWLWASALHDLALVGLLLELRIEPRIVFALAALNPVEAARLALLSSIDPELSVLGTVGFWLANNLGGRLTLLVGLLWPLLLAALSFSFALLRLKKSDASG